MLDRFPISTPIRMVTLLPLFGMWSTIFCCYRIKVNTGKAKINVAWGGSIGCVVGVWALKYNKVYFNFFAFLMSGAEHVLCITQCSYWMGCKWFHPRSPGSGAHILLYSCQWNIPHLLRIKWEYDDRATVIFHTSGIVLLVV